MRDSPGPPVPRAGRHHTLMTNFLVDAMLLLAAESGQSITPAGRWSRGQSDVKAAAASLAAAALVLLLACCVPSTRAGRSPPAALGSLPVDWIRM